MLWKRNCQRAWNHCCYQTANATLVMLSDWEGFGQAKNGHPRGCGCRLPEARRSVVAVHWLTNALQKSASQSKAFRGWLPPFRKERERVGHPLVNLAHSPTAPLKPKNGLSGPPTVGEQFGPVVQTAFWPGLPCASAETVNAEDQQIRTTMIIKDFPARIKPRALFMCFSRPQSLNPSHC
jgi:hypothetical protein